MQGIYKDYDMVPGDIPLTVALDLAMDDNTGVSSLALAHAIIIRSGCAGIVKE